MQRMAIYHLSAKPISRATGRSATGAAAYRAGETITDERTGLVFDYGKKRGIDHSEIMAPANAPEWAHDRAKLWNAVEHSEKRKDSQVAREVEVALPTELNLDQQRELVRSFARSQFVDAGMVADIAIHHAKGENPHAHILLTIATLARMDSARKTAVGTTRRFCRTGAKRGRCRPIRLWRGQGTACALTTGHSQSRASSGYRKST